MTGARAPPGCADRLTGRLPGAPTFFPGRGVPVQLVVSLFVPQVTGVHCHSCLDLLLGHLHSVVEDLEEPLRLLIFRQPAEEGMLPRETHRLSAPGRAGERVPLVTPKPRGIRASPVSSQAARVGPGLNAALCSKHLRILRREVVRKAFKATGCGASSLGQSQRLGKHKGWWPDFSQPRTAPYTPHTHETMPLVVATKCIFGDYCRASPLFKGFYNQPLLFAQPCDHMQMSKRGYLSPWAPSVPGEHDMSIVRLKGVSKNAPGATQTILGVQCWQGWCWAGVSPKSSRKR